MSANFFYEKLGYEQLVDCSDILVSNPGYQELGKIGADKVYFSGDFQQFFLKRFQLLTLMHCSKFQKYSIRRGIIEK